MLNNETEVLSEHDLREWENKLEEREQFYKKVEPFLDYYLNSFWDFWRYANFAHTPESRSSLSFFDEIETKFLNDFFAENLKKEKVVEEKRQKVRQEKALTEQKKKEESQAKRKATIATKYYLNQILDKQVDLNVRIFYFDDLKSLLNKIYIENGLEAVKTKTEEFIAYISEKYSPKVAEAEASEEITNEELIESESEFANNFFIKKSP